MFFFLHLKVWSLTFWLVDNESFIFVNDMSYDILFKRKEWMTHGHVFFFFGQVRERESIAPLENVQG